MKGAFVTLSVREAPFIARLRSHWSSWRHHGPISNNNHSGDLETAVPRGHRAIGVNNRGQGLASTSAPTVASIEAACQLCPHCSAPADRTSFGRAGLGFTELTKDVELSSLVQIAGLY
jgi:hypothetical protein